MAENRHIHYRYPTPALKFESESTYRTLIKAIQRHVPAGSAVLDIGCGRGEMMRLLTEADYVAFGCDMDEECVSMSSRYGEAAIVSIEELDVRRFSRRIDCIVLSHVLEHITNPHDFLMKLRSSFHGIMVVAVPNPYYSLFVFKALMRSPITYVNRGHLYSWDWFHFRTFIEMGVHLKIVQYYSDSVALPLPGPLRSLLARLRLLPVLEYVILKLLFPRFCRSIIAVVRVGAATESQGSILQNGSISW